jgi:hypothetical protein
VLCCADHTGRAKIYFGVPGNEHCGSDRFDRSDPDWGASVGNVTEGQKLLFPPGESRER